MVILFQVLRGVFYFSTLLLGVFLVRWDIIFGVEIFKVLKEVVMPWYLILCGVMVGYLISMIWTGKIPWSGELLIKESILKKSFIIGVGVGLLLALSYIIF